jgi:hypothetical protein
MEIAQVDATEVVMNVEKVLDKVNEVKFFSDRLHEVHNPFRVGNPNAFRYYFSAFLNAVYSVEQFAKWEVMAEVQAQGKNESEQKRGWQKYKKGWCDTLSPEEQELWSSLSKYGGIRGTEVHREWSRTTAKQKAVPLRDFPESHATQAYKAFYVMQQAWGFPGLGFPGVDSLTKELDLPPGTRAWSYINEHYVEIEGKSRSIPEVSKEIVNLCDRLVRHLQAGPI